MSEGRSEGFKSQEAAQQLSRHEVVRDKAKGNACQQRLGDDSMSATHAVLCCHSAMRWF